MIANRTPIARGMVMPSLLALGAVVLPAASVQAQLAAGAGRAEITITPAMLPIDGFTSVHDQLEARILLLDDQTTRFALLVVDQTALSADLVTAFKQQVATATGTVPDNVWVVASNSFSAPHVFIGEGRGDAGTPAYRAAMERAIATAAAQARSQLQPAVVAFGTGSTDVSVNRNVETPAGWWLGSNEQGLSDKTVSVLVASGNAGQPIAIAMNYAVQSSVMDQTGGIDGGKGVTADLGGFAARRAEHLLGQSGVALFMTGASGDQAPDYTAVRQVYDEQGVSRKVDIGDRGYALAELQGERLGSEAARVARAAAASASQAHSHTRIAVVNASITLPAKARPRALSDLKPSQQFDYTVTGTQPAPFSIVRIGDGVLIGTQVQLDAATGLDIRRRSPFRNALIVNMVNGGAKYLPSAEGYRRITYQAMNSNYAPGGAEKLADSIVAALQRLQSGNAAKGAPKP